MAQSNQDQTNNTPDSLPASLKRTHSGGNLPPAKKRKQCVHILLQEENLDDYKRRGSDWQVTNIISVFLKEKDAVDKMHNLMKQDIFEKLEEHAFPSDLPPDHPSNKEVSHLYKPYAKHFYLKKELLDSPTEQEKLEGYESEYDEEIVLKPESEKDIESVFEEFHQGEHCEVTKRYYIETHNVT